MLPQTPEDPFAPPDPIAVAARRRRLATVLGATVLLAATAAGLAWWQSNRVADLAEITQQLSQGQGPAAIVALKHRLQRDPADGPARALLGRALLDGGDAASADTELERAVDAGVPVDTVAGAWAEALMAQGKADIALRRLGSVAPPDAAEAARLDVQLALAHLDRGDEGQARARIASARRQMPDDAAAQRAEALLLARQQDLPGALAVLGRAIERQPRDAAAWGLRADLLRLQPDQQPAAIAAYRRALEISPTRAGDQASLVSLLLQTGDLPGARTQWTTMSRALPGHVLTDYLDALLALQEDRPQRAREASQRFLRRGATAPAMLVVAGLAEYRLGALAQAEALFGKAVTVAPSAAAPRHHLATVLLREGQPQRALAVIEPLLAAAAGDATAWGLAGRARMALGDYRQAAAAFDRAARLAPEATALQIDRAKALVRLGQAQAGLEALQTLATRDNGQEADLALFSLHMQRGAFDQAEQAALRLAGRTPAAPLADDLRSQVALARGQRSEARQWLAKALAKDGRYLPAVLRLAALDLADKDVTAARGRFEAVLQQEPNQPTALLHMASLALQQPGTGSNPGSSPGANAGPNPGPDLGHWLDRAVRAHPGNATVWISAMDLYLRAGRPDAALSTAQAALSALPADAGVVERAGTVQAGVGDMESATRSFRRLASLLPATAASRLRVAGLLRSTGAQGEADQMVTAALSLEPSSPEALVAAIGVALRERQFDKALGASRTLQAQLPAEPVGWLFEGDIEASRQRWDAALAAYGKALRQANPLTAPAGYHASLVGAGREAQAEQFQAEWLRSHPADHGFRLYLADQAERAGQPERAEAQLRAMLAQVPDHALALNNLAMLAHRRQRPDALALAERAVARAPDVPAFQDTLATVLQAAGQPERARAAQQRAVQLAPGSAALRLNLARLLLAQGERAQAGELLDQIARQGRSFDGQEEVARLRASLGLPTVPSRHAGSASAASPSAQAITTGLARELWRPALLAALGAAGLAMLLVAANQDAVVEVSRRRRLDAAPARVADWVQDLRRWPDWSALPELGPGTRREFSADSRSQGAHCRWASAGRLGSGTLTLVELLPQALVVAELQPDEAVEQRCLRRIVLQAEPGGGTELTLTHLGTLPYWHRVLLVPVGRQRWLGRALNAELARLARLTAQEARPDAAPGDQLAASA